MKTKMQKNVCRPILYTLTAACIAGVMTSCSTGSALRTGPAAAISSAESVQVLAEKPTGHYTVLGIVEAQAPKGLFTSATKSSQKAVAELRKQAAGLGANAVVIKNFSSDVKSGVILGGNETLSLPINSTVKRVSGVAILRK